jgi:hypothetical protein
VPRVQARWRVLDPRGYVVGCTGRETDRPQSAKATGPSHSIRAALTRLYLLLKKKPLLASQEENEWPREDHTNPFAQPERTGIVRVHQKSQDQPGAKVRRTTAPDRRAQAVFFRRRHQPRRPLLAKIRPGRPAPATGPGTAAVSKRTTSWSPKLGAPGRPNQGPKGWPRPSCQSQFRNTLEK